MRLCFLVTVRKATGRRVAGGRRVGKTDAFGGAGGLNFPLALMGIIGCCGVPKPGDEDRIASVTGAFEGAVFLVALSPADIVRDC